MKAIFPIILSALAEGLGLPPPLKGRVDVTRKSAARNRKPIHILDVLAPKKTKRSFKGRSAWQTYKPISIRRVGSKAKK